MTTPIADATINAGGVRLRGLMDSDAPQIERLASDPAVSLSTGSIPYPYPKGGALTWLQSVYALRREGEVEAFAVTLSKDDVLVGVMDLRRTEFAHVHEVGFWIGRPYWGQGICSRALTALTDFAFRRDPRLMRIFALSFPENVASARTQEKAGYRRESVQRYGLARIDEPRDAVVCAITRDDWNDRLS